MRKIIYNDGSDNARGGFIFVIPAPQFMKHWMSDNPGSTEDMFLEFLAKKDVPPEFQYEIMSDTEFKDKYPEYLI